MFDCVCTILILRKDRYGKPSSEDGRLTGGDYVRLGFDVAGAIK